MNGHKLDISSFFTQLGLSISSNLNWKPQIHCIASTHLSSSAFFLEPVAVSHLLSCLLYTNPRFILLWSTASTDPLSGVVLLNLLSIFSTKFSLKLYVTSTSQTLPFPYSLSLIVILLQTFPFSTAIFTDIAVWKSRILFLIQ